MKRIAVPIENGQVCSHFGHAPQFAVYDVADGQIRAETVLEAPPHQPGLLPEWLAGHEVNVVLAGGIGGRAQQLLAQRGIEVVLGVVPGEAGAAARAYLQGNLESGDNACDHTGCAH